MRFKIMFTGIALVFIASCKKDQVTKTEEPVSPVTGSRTQFTLDSIYLYAKQIYLWSDVLPSYSEFSPRTKYASYSTALSAFQAEILDLSQLKINTLTGLPYEFPVTPGKAKYSFLEEGNNTGSVATVVSYGQAAVIKDTVITQGTKNIAYIALGSFPLLSSCQTVLDQAFSTLSAANPQQLVIDLRTNGGGYVETAEYVANLVSPTSLNGKVMFSEAYNSLLQSGQGTILKHQPYLDANGKSVTYQGRPATFTDVDYTIAGNTHTFSKKGNLQSVKDIYFITSSATASASELLISALKPYFNVKLVGDTTYGKPVGFFPVNIDVYSVYLSGFLIKNSQGWSGYFQGIPADVLVTAESNPVFGDPTEACFKSVLALINGSSVSSVQANANQAISSNSLIQSNASTIIKPVISGMIENRLKLKINN